MEALTFQPDPSVHSSPERVKWCPVCTPKPALPPEPGKLDWAGYLAAEDSDRAQQRYMMRQAREAMYRKHGLIE